MRWSALVLVTVGCAAASAPAPVLHAPSAPSLEELIGRCDVGPAPKIERCEAATQLASKKPLDFGASPRALDDACDSGEAVACAWLGWTFEASARDPAARARADERLRSSNELEACEGSASRACTGVESGMSCCDRGIVSCPDGCEAACASAAATARAQTLGVLEARCSTGSALACHVAGMMLAYGSAEPGVGVVVAQDGTRALPLFTRACDRNLGIACVEEASFLEASDAADTRVEQLDRRACDLGAAAGCRALARRLEARGLQREGARLDARACRLGMPLVCDDLARHSAAAAAN